MLGDLVGYLQQQSAFANARLAGQQGYAARHETAAQNFVYQFDAGLQPAGRFRFGYFLKILRFKLTATRRA